jgi:uncharacterized membrane protein YdfJ with MMPL/SSD domain
VRVTIASIGLGVIVALAPLAALTQTEPAAAAIYKNDHVPMRSDTYRNRIGHMENESKQWARASAEYMRRRHMSLF